MEAFAPNYSLLREKDGEYVRLCIHCTSALEKTWMLEHGRTCLYLHEEDHVPARVSDWRSLLNFPVLRYRFGGHNIAGTRTDVWFKGPDNFLWWGVLYGQNTQLAHCKRTKNKTPNYLDGQWGTMMGPRNYAKAD
jgi:hypothetical protein